MQELSNPVERQTTLLDKHRNRVLVPCAKYEKMKELFKKHAGNIYAAYAEDQEVFTLIIPLWARTAIPCNGDENLTDKQAKIIFPYFQQDNDFNLGKFPKLTGKSLKYLPSHVEWLTLPVKTEYAHLKFLQKLENLRSLFIYHPFEGSEQDLKYLLPTKLDRVQMHCPARSVNLAEMLPKTLTSLTLREGELKDEDLSAYLLVASELKHLFLSNISSLTAHAFSPNLQLEKLDICICPDVDKETFFSLTTKVKQKWHGTAEEVRESQEQYRKRKALMDKDKEI